MQRNVRYAAVNIRNSRSRLTSGFDPKQSYCPPEPLDRVGAEAVTRRRHLDERCEPEVKVWLHLHIDYLGARTRNPLRRARCAQCGCRFVRGHCRPRATDRPARSYLGSGHPADRSRSRRESALREGHPQHRSREGGCCRHRPDQPAPWALFRSDHLRPRRPPHSASGLRHRRHFRSVW